MNPVAKKSLIALILAIICTIMICLIYYLGTPGKILGAIIFTLIAIFMIFEFIKPFDIPTWIKFIIPISGIFVMLIPFNKDFENFINIANKDLSNVFLIELLQKQFLFSVADIPGIGFPIMAGIIFIPCLFIKNRRKIMPTFLTILVAVIIICFAIKFFFYFTILQFSLTLVLIFSIVLVDTFAYFGGKLFGNKIFKRKLAPNISPNKTIEGAIIGYIISCSFLFLIFGLEYAGGYWGVNFGKLGTVNELVLLIVPPLTVPIIAIFGDLLFSFTKRKLSIKDFSNLIPSHGGSLDRFDSMILVFFLFPLLIGFV